MLLAGNVGGTKTLIGLFADEQGRPALFVSVYGAASGNLALTALATGGVFLGGGIALRTNLR